MAEKRFFTSDSSYKARLRKHGEMTKLNVETLAKARAQQEFGKKAGEKEIEKINRSRN